MLAEALTARFGEHHTFFARTMLDRIDACTAMEDRVSRRIDAAMAPLRQLTLRSYSMTDSPQLESARRVPASVYAIQLKLSASAQ